MRLHTVSPGLRTIFHGIHNCMIERYGNSRSLIEIADNILGLLFAISSLPSLVVTRARQRLPTSPVYEAFNDVVLFLFFLWKEAGI